MKNYRYNKLNIFYKQARSSDIEYIKSSEALISIIFKLGPNYIYNSLERIGYQNIILYQDIRFSGLKNLEILNKLSIDKNIIPNNFSLKVVKPLLPDAKELKTKFNLNINKAMEDYPICFNWIDFPAKASAINSDEIEIIFYPNPSEFSDIERNPANTFWYREICLKNQNFLQLFAHEISHVLNELRGSNDSLDLKSEYEEINSREEIQARMIEILYDIRRRIFIFKEPDFINLFNNENPRNFVNHLMNMYQNLLGLNMASNNTRKIYIKRFTEFFYDLKKEINS